ncbi:unnamed protein product [Parnassius apollo]|uniref:(apollo) hypothetical protein n=1 Tax=Parnassius apollo TaxID=110799 RepID=A0A8S3Y8H7_PARAO|nr:unnamed protein product [Parnassius apollo]
MPSCVVKGCKNNSKLNKKSDGITFHLFPTDIEIKSKWVAAIRVCRNEPQWTPSKSSVVCSDHFVSDDLYITQHGFRRVIRTGYPKKMLYLSSKLIYECPVSLSISAAPDHKLPESHNEAVGNTALPSTSACDPMSLVTVEIKSLASASSSSSDSELPESPNLDSKQITPGSNASTPSAFVLSTVKSQMIGQQKSDDQMSKKEMRIKLRRQSNLIKHSKKKIKTLLQKIRRLQKRNKSLKDIIHNLKKEKLVRAEKILSTLASRM